MNKWTEFWRTGYTVKTAGGQREHSQTWSGLVRKTLKELREGCVVRIVVKSGARYIWRDNQRPERAILCRHGQSVVFNLDHNNFFSLDCLLLFEEAAYTYLNCWTLMSIACMHVCVCIYIFGFLINLTVWKTINSHYCLGKVPIIVF